MSPNSGEESQASQKLYKLFLLWDSEALAVVAVLVGLFHLLLAIPMFYLDISLPFFYVLPLSLGCMFVTAGSITVACEKTPGKLSLKSCACANVVGALAAMSALCVYTSAINGLTVPKPCNITEYNGYDDFGYHYDDSFHACPDKMLNDFFYGIATLLFLYEIVAFIIHALLFFSAMKAVKYQPN